jgi:hypothetical protein
MMQLLYHVQMEINHSNSCHVKRNCNDKNMIGQNDIFAVVI